MKREDFVFTIGYDGEAAIVDSRAKRELGALSTMELFERGQYRASFASAIHSKDPSELEVFTRAFNAKAGTEHSTAEDFMRLFGIYGDGTNRVLAL